MFPNILDQGFVDVTDPACLHAELWGDFFSKVISCWIPLLMSTVVVGRDLLGSSIQCFPLSLVHSTVQSENETCVNSTNHAFSGVSLYTRQLSEFVNTYCAGKNSFPQDTVFNYQFFAMMLVIQAGLMYVSFLIWNLTKGREIICIVRFIAHDMEVLYDRFRKKYQVQTGGQEVGAQGNIQSDAQRQTVPVYGQEELVEAEKQWRADCTMYKWYLIKQVMSILFSVAFFVSYWFQPISIHSIRDKFPCSVEEKFSVTCTVPAATVHTFVWVTNMALLGSNVLMILIHISVLYFRAEDQPFREIGIRNAAPKDPQSCLKCFPYFNDSCLMHAFFKANIESVEKYNYVKNLLKVAPSRPES
ncbi:uncharacterized protein LOC118406059 isoform X2 [Branchiostoma floridae]|nr:uncharacterized protein LOC118406059 isoform X2 [Branchiostoma floridae]XP_035661810.1 uncharacterized protein LOC118406059 isoform X2 [Branchiostoma floridae]